MAGGGGTSAPPPSAEEKAVQAAQADNLATQTSILKEQTRQQELLAPILYKQAGITPQYDQNGKITGFTAAPEAVDPNADLRKSIETGLLQRSQAALQGQLPVDPSVTRSLDEQEAQLRDTLRANLGPGFETSTPGIQALADFSKRKTEVLAGASRDELTLSEQLGLARGAGNEQLIASQTNRQLAPIQGQAALAQLFGGAAQGAGQAVGLYQQDRNMALSAAMTNAQLKSANQNALIGAGAGMAGMAAGAIII
jgi:hypothetical protein